uniref:Uncharacterized protein n=1 Tax=Avena sativa TaxID=4498 RepID=A0ACD5WMJ3_AVESA
MKTSEPPPPGRLLLPAHYWLLRYGDLASSLRMSSKTKRSLEGSGGQVSKRAKDAFFDTLRFRPLNIDETLFSSYLVQHYIQQWGQNLFIEGGDGFVDVRFVDSDAARRVINNIHKAPFQIEAIRSIKLDNIRVKPDGEVKMYQPSRDVDHYDGTPRLPHGCNNPFPIKFEPPKVNTERRTSQRPPRFMPIYPLPVQPPPIPHGPPFKQPVWPSPPVKDFGVSPYPKD